MTARFLTSCASRDWLLSVPVILSKHRFRRESVSAGVLIISMCERGGIDPPREYTTYVKVDTSLVPKISYATMQRLRMFNLYAYSRPIAFCHTVVGIRDHV